MANALFIMFCIIHYLASSEEYLRLKDIPSIFLKLFHH